MFAEYLVSPTSFFYLDESEQNATLDDHIQLYRELPGRSALDGITAYRAAEDVSRSMLVAGLPLPARREYLARGAVGIPDLSGVTTEWSQSIQHEWEPHFRRMPLRYRQGWLTLRLDFGREGDNLMENVGKTIVGHDFDDPEVIDRYRELAATMAAAIPTVFDPTPAAAQQIWWRWNATLSSGVWREPLPDVAFDPNAVLDESAFTPGFFDENAAEIYGPSGLNADNPLVRIYRSESEGLPDSYQAILPISKFTAAGLTFPRSALFKRADDLSTGGIVINWHQSLKLNAPDKLHSDMLKMNINISDQWEQRGVAAEVDTQLPRQMFLSRELASKCEEGSVVRAGHAGLVFTVAAPTPELVAEGVKRLKTELARADIGFKRWRGGQKWLAHTLIPGAEAVCDMKKLRHPTTSDDLATLVPLVSSQLGDTFGVPLGMDITMPGMQDVVLSDLLAAPTRDKGATMVLGGDPGRGKSTCIKNLEYSWAKLGARLALFDPTPVREHERALTLIDESKKLIIDAHQNRYSLDCVRLARRNHEIIEELRRQGRSDIEEDHLPQPTDHLLSLTGFPVSSDPARRFQKHVAPRNLMARGIRDQWGLIEYLRDLPSHEKTAADETLLNELEALASDRHLRALWDRELPVPDYASYQVVVWNTAWLELPTNEETTTAHLHEELTQRQRAGRAIYGLAIDTTMQLFTSRPKEQSMLIVEECYDWINSAAGGKAAYRLMTQGRKSNSGMVAVVQNPVKTFNRIGSEFVTQKLNFGFKNAEMARTVLAEWCGRDLERHEDLLRQYAQETSPVQRVNRRNRARAHLHGTVIRGREGEAWFLDEADDFGKIRALMHPDPQVQKLFDTNPMTAQAS
ncbi:ATP-binding protein [Mycolicibacterium mageritense]|uniref:ATP-binding protein n=1 Tax=Mycolicibacterium mageritense TaxID=53462 RepID=UPI0023F52D5A|nr:ATP-binding protein [Mycolicibacterium mageritense]